MSLIVCQLYINKTAKTKGRRATERERICIVVTGREKTPTGDSYEFKCSGKTLGPWSQTAGYNLGSSTYHLYELETNYLTALNFCGVGLRQFVDNLYQVLSPEPDNIVGTC